MFGIVMTGIMMLISLFQINWGSEDPIKHATYEICFWILFGTNIILNTIYDNKRK